MRENWNFALERDGTKVHELESSFEHKTNFIAIPVSHLSVKPHFNKNTFEKGEIGRSKKRGGRI